VVALEMIVSVLFTHLIGVYLSYILMGVGHQLMVMNIIYYLNVRFKENLVRYTGYVFTGTAISFLWGLVFSKIVNPMNIEKTVEFILPSGDIEHTFPPEVSMRFPYLCFVYGVSNLIVSFLISFFISDIEPIENLSVSDQDMVNSFKEGQMSLYSKSFISTASLYSNKNDLKKLNKSTFVDILIIRKFEHF
jgi:hypothetical protein